MILNRLLVLGFAVVLTACGSTGERPDSMAKDAPSVAQADQDLEQEREKRMRCKRVKPIGSHRTELVCNTREQEAEEARRTQDAYRRVQTNTPRPRGGDG